MSTSNQTVKYIKIASTQDIKDGEIQQFTVQGKIIAVANIGGEFFAIDDTCTHAQCSLAEQGFLDGISIVCGCHGAMFDVTTGRVLSLPAPIDLRSYPVKVEQGYILVALS